MSAKSPARPPTQGVPPSSPRLPSPPPLPELQLGPRSPSLNASTGDLSLDSAASQDEGAARRIRPGTSASDMARGPPFVPLHQLESPFQLQEYLKSSYASVTRDESSHTVKPITRESAIQLATPPIQQDTGEPVDRNLWLYELCRFLVQRTNRLVVSFFADSPPCSNQTCPEMRASEWQYLCAVHEPPKSCCAIDYCCHTLDWAANVLTSTKHFPSRLSLGGEGGSAYQSMRQLTNIFRRVYRIYAHAWFQHREAFWMLEQEEGLYRFFRTVCDAYSLIPEDGYTIPPEAEGEKEDLMDTPVTARPDIHILRNDAASTMGQSQQPSLQKEKESELAALPAAPTQRRHRHTPSTGTQVNPIAEGPEEDEEDVAKKTVQISHPVAAESIATATASSARQALATGPKPPRSPKPDMTIPISKPQFDPAEISEDPTPTPESHGSDPFLDQVTILDDSKDKEANSEVSESLSEVSIPPTAKIAMPPLKTEVHAPQVSKDGGSEVRSPGGGSITTVGHDILSGLLAHHEDQENDTAGSQAAVTSESILKSEEIEPPVHEKAAPSPETSSASEAVQPAAAEANNELDEEMGEIRLEKVPAISDPETDVVQKREVENVIKEKDNLEVKVQDSAAREDINGPNVVAINTKEDISENVNGDHGRIRDNEAHKDTDKDKDKSEMTTESESTTSEETTKDSENTNAHN